LSARRDAAAALCTRDAAQFAAQSCAEQAVAAGLQRQVVQPAAAPPLEPAARQRRTSQAQRAQPQPEVASEDAVEQQPTAHWVQPESWKLRAFPREEAQLRDAARALVQLESPLQEPKAGLVL
jgi:hypothetical protein